MQTRHVITVAALLACGAGFAQPRRADRLPPALEGEATWLFEVAGDSDIRLAQSTEMISKDADKAPPTGGPPSGKPGLLQSIDFNADWAPRFEDDSIGRSTFGAAVGVGVPPSLLGTPLLINTRGAIHLVDGPDFVDVPARLYDLDLSVATFKQLSPRWSARVSVTTGVYSDDHSFGDADALRVSGFGAAIYQAAPGWQWIFGAAYLNRDDIAVVPAVGLIHDRGDVRYELTFPRPRVVWRLPQDALCRERSLYLAGELGGGAWAVRRTDGTTDTLNLSRWGILLGYETGAAPGAGVLSRSAWKTRYEFGYLFGRRAEFADSGEDFSLDDSLIARVGWSY